MLHKIVEETNKTVMGQRESGGNQSNQMKGIRNEMKEILVPNNLYSLDDIMFWLE